MTTIVRHELRRLSSTWPDHSLMYPGVKEFVWVKAPGMPWVLASIMSYPGPVLESEVRQ